MPLRWPNRPRCSREGRWAAYASVAHRPIADYRARIGPIQIADTHCDWRCGLLDGGGCLSACAAACARFYGNAPPAASLTPRVDRRERKRHPVIVSFNGAVESIDEPKSLLG